MGALETGLALISDPSGSATGWLLPADELESFYYHEFVMVLPAGKLNTTEVRNRGLAAGFRIIQLHETAAPYSFATKMAAGERFLIGYITADFSPRELSGLQQAIMADQEWNEDGYAGTVIVRERRVDLLKQKSLELSWDAVAVIPEDPEVKVPVVPIVIGGLVLLVGIVIAVKVSR